MSRWLKNVNALLENLDNQVEETVEEHRFNRTLLGATAVDNGEGGAVGDASEEIQGVEDILAKRGLLSEDDDEEEEMQGNVKDFDDTSGTFGDKSNNHANHEENFKGDGEPSEASSIAVQDDDTKSDVKGEILAEGSAPQTGGDTATDDNSEGVESQTTLEVRKKSNPSETNKSDSENSKQQPPSAPSSSNISGGATAPNSNNNSTINAASMKELRKLRRHVLQLNADLESSEREIEAQRQELDRAASRMERDRSRHKQEKESHDASHKAEIAALTAAHERALQHLKDTNEAVLQDMEARVARAEQQRAKEGGERDAELADALDRERVAIATASRLKEEKSTIDERISTLNTEISRLETRLEHATSQMELASERERNAEEQLDKALSLHAKQLGMRQKRESELEQMVADLGAALVVAKNKVEAGMKVGIGIDSTSNDGISNEDEDLKAQLQDSQDEIETLRAQLSLERQRCSTLHSELQDLSKEQADELSGAHARQRQYERKISDLTTLVAKLESSRRSMRQTINDSLEDIEISDETYTSATDFQHPGDEKKETDHLKKQIASLSEKIFEQQSKIDHSRAELSTMKNRLQAAIRRADAAEKSLEDANQRLIMMDAPSSAGVAFSGTMSSTDEEMGTKPRRRRGPIRRGFQRRSQVESIRSALGLHHGRLAAGGCQEGMAQLLDTVDSISIDLGGHFRYSPISRLAFIAYLLILHIWAFFLIVYHAHAQGAVGGDHYGPESLLYSYRHMEQMPRVHSANP
ncbi:hypothetical protein ACHAXM_012168 [Skeletonema potamos]